MIKIDDRSFVRSFVHSYVRSFVRYTRQTLTRICIWKILSYVCIALNADENWVTEKKNSLHVRMFRIAHLFYFFFFLFSIISRQTNARREIFLNSVDEHETGIYKLYMLMNFFIPPPPLSLARLINVYSIRYGKRNSGERILFRLFAIFYDSKRPESIYFSTSRGPATLDLTRTGGNGRR